MNTIAVIALAFNINTLPVCGIDWQLPPENEKPFSSVYIGVDTFKLAAGLDPEFIFNCADEADIIHPTFECLIQAQWMHRDYLNCLASLNKRSQTQLEETP